MTGEELYVIYRDAHQLERRLGRKLPPHWSRLKPWQRAVWSRVAAVLVSAGVQPRRDEEKEIERMALVLLRQRPGHDLTDVKDLHEDDRITLMAEAHEAGARRGRGRARLVTVYVDKLPSTGWGRWNGGAHMLASDLDELHAMADRLGLKRKWFQDKRIPHYDLTARKREHAVRLGAVEIGDDDYPPDIIVKDANGYRRKGHGGRGLRTTRSKAPGVKKGKRRQAVRQHDVAKHRGVNTRPCGKCGAEKDPMLRCAVCGTLD